MNSEFQILRWGIPGWVFLATFTVFKLAAVNYQLDVFLRAISDNPAAITGVSAFFVALGVPIGYLIYQIYFWLKWTFAGKRMYLAVIGIRVLERTLSMKNKRDDWKLVERHFDHMMSVVAAKKEINLEDLARRYEWYSSRTSRTHGLGSSIIAMILGLIIFILLSIGTEQNWYYLIIAFVPYSLAFIATIFNYKAMNDSTFLQMNWIMKDIDNADEKETID